MRPSTQNVPCFCGRACVYQLLRCDVCHRGVHFACIKMTLADASALSTYVCTACQGTTQEGNLAERLKSEGKPGAVVFTTVCHQHNTKTGHRRGISTKPTLGCGTETLSKDRCHICEHRCNFEMIQCDNCAAWCHYACAKMTPEIAERIDKWYCRRCLKKDSDLQITYAEDSEDCVPPLEQPNNDGQGVRQPKRRFEPDGRDRTEKRARNDVECSPVKDDDDQRSDDEELYLNLEEKLFLDLEEEELFLDLEDEN